jgi:UDP-glucose 4-epimerase/UDP-arabinose 4-epimerase
LRAVVLRYFNACGADPEGLLGELRDPETHLVPRIMMAIQGYIDGFAIFGADFPTPDGTAIRDYVHVTDLAAAHVTAVERLLAGHGGGTYNLGTGRGHSVKEVLAAVQQVSRVRLPEVKGSRRPGDPAVLVADPTRARQELAFEPRFSDLRTIAQTAWAWHLRAHPRRGAA